MSVFLILSSLSLIFYVGLLVALYRDGQKRRVMSVPPVRKLLAGSESEFAMETSQAGGTLATRQRNSSDDVLWIPVAKHHWKPKSGAVQSSGRVSVCMTRDRLTAAITGSSVEETGKDNVMRDIVLVAISVAFFLLSIGYVKFCDRVK